MVWSAEEDDATSDRKGYSADVSLASDVLWLKPVMYMS